MKDIISWHQLEKNSFSKEISFELFCFQIANKKFGEYGNFDDYYNTAGSEFYLELKKDFEELNLKTGDIIGWQAKFWLNSKSLDNSSLNKNHQEELVEGLKKSINDKPNLKYWIICTPGKFINNKPHYPWDTLKNSINQINTNVNIEHWHRDKFEAFFHSDREGYSSIFNYYFNNKFIGVKFINDFSQGNLEYLENKFDIDLYVPDEKEASLLASFDIDKGELKIKETIEYLSRKSKEIEDTKILKEKSFEELPHNYTNEAKDFLKSHIVFIHDLIEIISSKSEPLFFIQTIHYKLLDFFDKKEIDRESLNKKIGEIFHDKQKSDIDYRDQNWHDTIIKYSAEIRDTLFSRKLDSSLLNQCKKLIGNEYHVFGGASNGKTNLVCSIANNQIQKRIPVLLFLGSSFKNQVPPKARILQLLEISHDFTFTEFLGVLSNLANLKNTRIPIIIDGLNESSPTSGEVWNQEIYSLIKEIKRFPNLALITTCRDKSEYIQQIFGKNIYTDIENHIYLKGFTERNVNLAVGKYFHKKDITVKSENYDNSLFFNPLRLKIFSEVNKGKKNIEISLHTIVNSIDKYLDEISTNISKINGVKDRIIETRLRKGLLQVGNLLWTKNTRDLKTFEEFRPLFDNEAAVWCDSLTFKIIDEGLCFQRNIEQGDEIIQFTIDLIGGYQIAKSTFFSECTTEETVRKLDNQATKEKLYGQNKSIRHPLYEDILIALSYLIQKKIGKQLFDFFPINSVVVESIGNLELVGFNNDEKEKLVQFIKKNVYDINIKSQIVQKLYNDVIQKKYFSVFDLGEDIFLSFSQYEINSFWCELIRNDSFKLQELLKYISKHPTDYPSDEYNVSLFVLMLTASTDKKLRNEATKCLLYLGLMFPKCILTLGQKFKLVNDGYILESLICSLTGTVLRLNNKEFTETVIKFLQEDFLISNTTNHIAILDYIQTIFEFGFSHYEINYDKNIVYRNKDEIWNLDKELIKKDDGNDFFWSYEMMDYDFIKFQIVSLSKHSYGSISKYSRAEIISFIYERIRQKGYTKDLYSPIEEKITKDNKYRREEVSEQLTKYNEKYLYTTYLELAGFLMLNNQIKPEYKDTLRFSYIFFDPTFPITKTKTQIINDCFLPHYNEDIQNWVIKDSSDLLNEQYISIPFFEKTEMVLLYASLNQKDDDSKTYMTLYLSTYVFDSKHKEEILKTFTSSYIHQSNGLSQIFGGEISWRDHIEGDEDMDYSVDEDEFEYSEDSGFDDLGFKDEHGVNVESNDNEYRILESSQYFPLVNSYSWSSWTRDRYQNPSFVFLDSMIANKMELDFKIEELSHIDKNGKIITNYYKTDNSEFLFIDRQVLEKYLGDNNLDLIWNKFIAKYGEFGVHQDKKLDPSYKDSKVIDFYSERAKN